MSVENYRPTPSSDIADRLSFLGISLAEVMDQLTGRRDADILPSGEPTATAFEITTTVTVTITGATDDELLKFADHMTGKGCVCTSTGQDSASCDCKT